MRDYKGADYKDKFCEFLGEEKSFRARREKENYFTLKSGRRSPHFVNLGDFNSGPALDELGMAYAARVMDALGKGEIKDFDVVFGLPYKGIPLATMLPAVLFKEFGKNVRFSSYRKEMKDHGDRGMLLGYKDLKLSNGIYVVDDVLTTGGTKEEGLDVLRGIAPEVPVVGLGISVDREETLPDQEKTAIQEFSEKHNIPVLSIVNLTELVDSLMGKQFHGEVLVDEQIRANIGEYLEEFGLENPWRE